MYVVKKYVPICSVKYGVISSSWYSEKKYDFELTFSANDITGRSYVVESLLRSFNLHLKNNLFYIYALQGLDTIFHVALALLKVRT